MHVDFRYLLNTQSGAAKWIYTNKLKKLSGYPSTNAFILYTRRRWWARDKQIVYTSACLIWHQLWGFLSSCQWVSLSLHTFGSLQMWNYHLVKCLQRKAKLTGASVVAFWVPHTKVSHGAGGEAHAYLTDVIALQEDEELRPTFNAAVILRASVTAFGARWWPLSTNCGNIKITNREKGTVSVRKYLIAKIIICMYIITEMQVFGKFGSKKLDKWDLETFSVLGFYIPRGDMWERQHFLQELKVREGG